MAELKPNNFSLYSSFCVISPKIAQEKFFPFSSKNCPERIFFPVFLGNLHCFTVIFSNVNNLDRNAKSFGPHWLKCAKNVTAVMTYDKNIMLTSRFVFQTGLGEFYSIDISYDSFASGRYRYFILHIHLSMYVEFYRQYLQNARASRSGTRYVSRHEGKLVRLYNTD